MPSTAYTFGGTFDPDSGMQGTTYGEFMNDDESSLFADNEILQALDDSSFQDPKALIAASDRTVETTQLELHRVSSSSGSSRSTGSNSSRNGSRTSADIMMTKDSPFSNFKSASFSADGTDLTMLDDSSFNSVNHFDEANHFDEKYFDFDSASSSPSAAPDAHNALSPGVSMMSSMAPVRSPNVKRPKTHMKAQSVRNHFALGTE